MIPKCLTPTPRLCSKSTASRPVSRCPLPVVPLLSAESVVATKLGRVPCDRPNSRALASYAVADPDADRSRAVAAGDSSAERNATKSSGCGDAEEGLEANRRSTDGAEGAASTAEPRCTLVWMSSTVTAGMVTETRCCVARRTSGDRQQRLCKCAVVCARNVCVCVCAYISRDI